MFSETTSASDSNCFVEDIAAGAAVPPVQPKHIKFPAVVISGKSRCFLTKWYEDYKWLEYSVSYDAMFCYPCRFFAIGNRRAEKTFTEHGYRNWKHARDALKRHDSCVTHKDAMLSWEQYKRDNTNQTSVDHLLDSHREKKIRKNRHYIITISQALLYCCLQEISIQGHQESNLSQNRGIFWSS